MPHPELLLEHIDFCKKMNLSNIEEIKWITTLENIKKGIQKIQVIAIPDIDNPNHKNIKEIFSLPDYDNKILGGINSCKYVLSELIDNIYQHSEFKYANFTIIRFKDKIDMMFFDTGTTFKENFKRNGLIFHLDSDAIVSATVGLSSKPGLERGQGLQSSIRIIQGLDGETFISSGWGALYLSNNIKMRYNLTQQIPGTLIIIRTSYPSRILDVYKFIE